MKKNDLARLRSIWIALFSLGVIMLNYPFLQAFNQEITFFDIPLILLYFMTVWPLAICISYLFSKEFSKTLK